MTANSPRLSDQEYEQAIGTYRGLMEEFKIRRTAILITIDAIKIDEYDLPRRIGVELCFLQLRMICETIALACLVAHNDIIATQSGKLPKKYQADVILNKLEELHPNFFPRTITYEGTDSATGTINIKSADRPGRLAKSELIKLNGLCGNHLHRGSLAKLDTKPFDPKVLDTILDWLNKATTLLDQHMITLIDPDHIYFVLMEAGPENAVTMIRGEIQNP